MVCTTCIYFRRPRDTHLESEFQNLNDNYLRRIMSVLFLFFIFLVALFSLISHRLSHAQSSFGIPTVFIILCVRYNKIYGHNLTEEAPEYIILYTRAFGENERILCLIVLCHRKIIAFVPLS